MYVLKKLNVLVCHSGCSNLQLMHIAEICSAEPSSAKLDVPKSEIRGSSISRSLDDLGERATAEPENWRTPLVRYLQNPSHVTDRKVR
jgi:hypothetical protein